MFVPLAPPLPELQDPAYMFPPGVLTMAVFTCQVRYSQCLFNRERTAQREKDLSLETYLSGFYGSNNAPKPPRIKGSLEYWEGRVTSIIKGVRILIGQGNPEHVLGYVRYELAQAPSWDQNGIWAVQAWRDFMGSPELQVIMDKGH